MLLVPRTAALAALALCLAAPAAAQTAPAPAPSASPTPLPDIGRVVTSDRHEEPLANTTRPTFVVDRAAIEARGDRSVADALTGVPGVSLYRYGAAGAQATVFIHGTNGSAQVLVLLDGIPVAPGSSGQIDLGSFSTAGVRRIEVVEGSASTLYGTSAVGGVINIITAVPRGAYLETAAGTLGDRDLRVSAGTGRLGIALARHLATNAYDYPAAAAYPGGTRDNADAAQTAARVSYDAELGPDLSARVRLGSSALHLGVPGDLTFGPTLDARQNVAQNDARVELTRTSAQSVTVLTLGASRQLLAYTQPSLGPENDTNDGRAQLSLRHVVSGGASTLTTGLDLARESAVITNVAQYDAAFTFLGYATTGVAQAQSALYAQEQYVTPRGVRLQIGLRGEHDAPVGGVLSPSAGLAIPLGAGLRLAFNASSAFRVPTIVDLYYPGLANPNLKPERSGDGDLTLSSERVLGGVALTLFGREANDLIALDPANGYLPENIAKASVRGLQATLRTRSYHGVLASLSITDTYRALNLAGPATRLPFDPVFAASLNLDHPLAGGALGFGATANVFGPHREGAALNRDGQTTVDAYVRARLGSEAVLSLRARNLGGERYAPILGYPAPGRTFGLELATR
jgi:vitamin B12 transporter